MNKKLNIISILLILPFYLIAQIGVNTESPKGTLGVKSVSSTIPVVISRNSDNTELARLLDSGYLGLDGAAPVVKLDLRGTHPDGEMGLGETSLTASAAGAGAIRYNNGIEYSDGNVWYRLTELPVKGYIIAKHTSPLTILERVSTTWTTWEVEMDATNSFDPSTGVFTAPHTGIYSVSCTGMFENIVASSTLLRVELNLTVYSSTSPPQLKSAVAVPIDVIGKVVNVSCVNKAFLRLQAGDRMFLYTWHNVTPSIEMTTDGSYNTLTISEM